MPPNRTKAPDTKPSTGPLHPGQIVADSLLVEKTIGQGGMAVVYQVRSIRTGIRWALKLLTRSDPIIRKRLLREGELQRSLQHPHLIGVKQVLKVEGQPALLMELAQGPSLQWTLRRKHLTLPETTILFRGIVAGVGGAHSAGVIHRDLKPANVLLHNDGDRIVPRVTDFGIAKDLESDDGATQTGAIFGTPAYMAPEQMVDSGAVDRRADIWSLGCILYRMATGRRAFPQKGALLYAAVVQGHYVHARKIRPDLPDQVVFAIQEMLTLDVNKRLQDCRAIIAILEGKTAIMHGDDLGSLDTRAPEVRTRRPTTLPLNFLPTAKAPTLDEHFPEKPSGKNVQLGTHTTTSSLISDMPGLDTLNAMKDHLDAGLSRPQKPTSPRPHSSGSLEDGAQQDSLLAEPHPPQLQEADTEDDSGSATSLVSLTEVLLLLAFVLGTLIFALVIYFIAQTSGV